MTICTASHLRRPASMRRCMVASWVRMMERQGICSRRSRESMLVMLLPQLVDCVSRKSAEQPYLRRRYTSNRRASGMQEVSRSGKRACIFSRRTGVVCPSPPTIR